MIRAIFKTGMLLTALAFTPGGIARSAQIAPNQGIVNPPSPLAGPQQPFPPLGSNRTPGLSQKQQQALLKSNYKKMKKDTAQLVSLATSLQKAVEQSNENVLSVDVVATAEKIEKLAKKIKNTARGY